MSTSDGVTQAPILAAYLPSSSGREPVEFGIAASRVIGAPLTIITIRQGGPMVDTLSGGRPDDSMGGDAKSLEHLGQDLRRRKVEAEIITRDARTVGGGLTDALEELSPQLIVLASTKRGAVGAALLGTTIERVLHAATCPVAVVPHGYKRPENGVQLIGVAYTPEPEGVAALRAAAALARAGGVRLRAITVLDPKHAEDQASGIMAKQHHDAGPEVESEARERLAEKSGLRAALAEVAADIDSETDILYNEPAEGLIAASRHVDLLVMGSRARGPRRAAVLGSVSRKVAEGCACPVVIVPRGTGERSEALFAQAKAMPAS